MMTEHTKYRWTNASVRELAGDRDPVQVISEKARAIALQAMQEGWAGPPFDPFALAQIRGVDLLPRDDVLDARTVLSKAGTPLIEFNPNRPTRRVRFSIAHELAHTFFSDWPEKVRNRFAHDQLSGNDWQLEMLCNIAAGELLMPIGSFPEIKEYSLKVQELIRLREKYQVSSEAIFLRALHLTNAECFVFSSSRSPGAKPDYQIDYAIGSSSWNRDIPRGMKLPSKSAVADCIAIGFTAGKKESWGPGLKDLLVECVGIPAYPSQVYPRVIGIAGVGLAHRVNPMTVQEFKGDATLPRGEGKKIVAHIVNDKSPIWGRGFGLALRKRWPEIQSRFKNSVLNREGEFRLGNIFSTQLNDSLMFVHMICQHGYGESRKPRLRYTELVSCLEKLASLARSEKASVHMPRIGTGEAGGNWTTIKGLIEEVLCSKEIGVTVYALPSQETSEQPSLPFVS